MHSTWTARFGVTAAFVGGFWLLGQATAEANENDATTAPQQVPSIVSGPTGETEAEASGGDGGYGGDATTTSQNTATGGDAGHTGDNVSLIQAGNLCAAAYCSSSNNVGHSGDSSADANAGQSTATVGGDGGDGGDADATTGSSGSNWSTSETESEATGGDGGDGGDADSYNQNAAQGGTAGHEGDNVSLVQVGNACLLAHCSSSNNVGHSGDSSADANAWQNTATVGGQGGDGGDAYATTGSGGNTGNGSYLPTRFPVSSSGETESEATGGDGGDGGDADSYNQNAAQGGTAGHEGDNVSLVQVGNACLLLAHCSSSNNVGHSGDSSADANAWQNTATVGGDGGDGGDAYATTGSGGNTGNGSYLPTRFPVSSSDETESEATGGDGGDGGDAYSWNANEAYGGTAGHSGHNLSGIQAGNACLLLAHCSSSNNVGHSGDSSADANAWQNTATVGGDGGDGGNAHATTQRGWKSVKADGKKQSSYHGARWLW